MIKEIALTNGRHTIVSPITGEEVTESFFGRDVEDVLNVEEQMETVLEHLKGVPLDAILVVYVTGLTPLFQAVFAAWLTRNCSGPTMSLDLYPGNLVFAHYNLESKFIEDAPTYVFRDALTGSTEKPKSS